MTSFEHRHIGPRDTDIQKMLGVFHCSELNEFTEKVIPEQILSSQDFHFLEPLSEEAFLKKAQLVGTKNKVYKSYIGQGYYNTITPSVILRNVFQSPAWYTSYTPYQAELSQGRLEAILNFQTMVSDLTAMPISNASLLDEGTAAAEAVNLCMAVTRKKKARTVICDKNIFHQTLEVVQTRAFHMGLEVCLCDLNQWTPHKDQDLCVITQYPNSLGGICSPESIIQKAQEAEVLTIACTDLLALTLIQPPGEFGFDVVVGSTQRFGVPLGFGGPHAAFLSTKEAYKRSIPGRIIGVSQDRLGKMALRLSLQTREQHIRRDKATSNICTSQVLLAVMASMYGVYHGPQGLKDIAQKILNYTLNLKRELCALGFKCAHENFFDTLSFFEGPLSSEEVINNLRKNHINIGSWALGWTFAVDETWTDQTYFKFLKILGLKNPSLNQELNSESLKNEKKLSSPKHTDCSTNLKSWDFQGLKRSSHFMTHEVFNSKHSETEMLRYIYDLQNKDLSLTHSMIPLGSCTMKLNATSEMIPISDEHWSHIHPFVPKDQHQGYSEMIKSLESHLKDITGFSAISFQPNAGSQGEYAGLLVIKKYLIENNQKHRNICLIPSSAHGTNPASAVMVNFKVVVVKCDTHGNIDLEDLQEKCFTYKENLAALMVTYPSTHGVFESEIKKICQMVHECGGQVYLDGANLNAMVGLVRPQELGADVAHMNLHKTFCIPHGGGGPGVGPIGVAEHLVPFLPTHSLKKEVNPHKKAITAISSAPWGSASILPISWGYIEMMGSEGLKKASQVAILNANYIAYRLKSYYKILFTGKNGYVAHECIVDVRPFKSSAGLTVDDFAKRLMDYGFHAPTMSWPVAGTLMIEPTESEALEELNRFCEAMISIHSEVKKIESGVFDIQDNPLTQAPHTLEELTANEWNHIYSREQAAFPLGPSMNKFWTPVSRVDNVFGDRNLVCSCPPMEEYQSSPSAV